MTVPRISINVPLPLAKIAVAILTSLPIFAAINWVFGHRPLISDFECGGLIGYCLCILGDWIQHIKAKP